MNIWVAIPSRLSKDEAHRAIDTWAQKGYYTAIFRSRGSEDVPCDIQAKGDYQGYANAVNFLRSRILATDPLGLWIVAADEYTTPDPSDPHVIGQQCTVEFRGTFGVVQPTFGATRDEICTGAWLGSAFCRRMYGGRGPFYPRYYDATAAGEELMQVANRLGVLRQRKDLYQARRLEAAARMGGDVNLLRRRLDSDFPGHEPIPAEAGVLV